MVDLSARVHSSLDERAGAAFPAVMYADEGTVATDTPRTPHSHSRARLLTAQGRLLRTVPVARVPVQ